MIRSSVKRLSFIVKLLILRRSDCTRFWISFRGSHHTKPQLLADGIARQSCPSLDLPDRYFRAKMAAPDRLCQQSLISRLLTRPERCE